MKNSNYCGERYDLMSFFLSVLQEGEISDILLYYIVYFCENLGLSLIHACFRETDPSNFPLPLAHSLICIVQQVRHSIFCNIYQGP